MYKLTLAKDYSILSADKEFRARFKDKKLTRLFTLSGSNLTEELKDDSSFVALLDSDKNGKCYVSCTCQRRRNTILVTGSDITKEMRDILKMRSLYVAHPLTGLKNRFVLEEDYAALSAEAVRQLLVFRLKIANIEEYRLLFGSYFVENLLPKVAQMVVHVFGADSTYHITENEFLTIKQGGEVYLEGMLSRAASQIENVISIDEKNVKLDIKYGVVDFNKEGENTKVPFETFLSVSRLAVETAARTSAGVYILKYFTERIPTDYSQKGVIADMIKEGVFDVYYQPQLDLKKNTVICFEALTRIVNGDKKDITTSEIISIAEKYGGILPLGEFVYKSAMDFGKKLQDMGSPAGISINTSTIQLLERGFASAFINYMKKIKLDSKRVHIEITESSMMYSIESILPKLNAFIDADIDIHIDDFGTGYSSLSYLRRLPASAIKIDKSFIDDITFSSEGETIVNNIIAVAKKLKKLVIAEGVETKAQADILQKNGCDVVQGFYFSKAVPQKEALEIANQSLKGGEAAGA